MMKICDGCRRELDDKLARRFCDDCAKDRAAFLRKATK